MEGETLPGFAEENKNALAPLWDKSVCFCDTTQIGAPGDAHSLPGTIIPGPVW